jgi:kynurenine formamidase
VATLTGRRGGPMGRGLLLAGAAAVVVACAPAPPAWPNGELVDLTHAYDADTIFWPTAPRFVLTKDADGLTAGGYYYASNEFSMSEHGGTHIDAPRHFAEGRRTVDEIPIADLIGPAVVIDVTAAAAANPDYRVSVADVEAFERDHGRIPDGAIVVLRTGFARRWPDAAAYLGTADRGEGAVPTLHFPGLDPEAARWIVAHRPIAAIGLDTASIDYGQSTTFDSHRVLFEHDIPAFENLANLDRLPAVGATVIALPMKIRGGSGGPLRALAVLPGG